MPHPPSTRAYRAVSLDLWFTTLSFSPDSLEVWQEARERALLELLEGPGGRPPSEESLAAARRAVRQGLPGGLGTESIEPSRYLGLLAEEAGVRIRGDPAKAGRRYSDAGLEEAPPRINPEAVALCAELQRRQVPVLCITNTGRLGRSWEEFLRRRGGPVFREIITSCEVGKGKPEPEIFAEAARRMGLSTPEILHVGDRWDIDIVGARQAGSGRVLYRGLWPAYPEAEDREISLRMDDGGEDVARIDRLDEVLTKGLLGPAP